MRRHFQPNFVTGALRFSASIYIADTNITNSLSAGIVLASAGLTLVRSVVSNNQGDGIQSGSGISLSGAKSVIVRAEALKGRSQFRFLDARSMLMAAKASDYPPLIPAMQFP